MATTFIDYTGDGNATKSFSFPSIQVSDVKVEVDEVVKTSGVHYNITGYTTTGGGNVVFTSGNIPTSPSAIRIFRDTDVDNPKATYTAGSSIKAADLNDNQEQILFASQEEQNQSVITSRIKDGAVTTAKIKDDAITTAKIANSNVTLDKLASNSVSTAKIQDLNVTTAKLANDAVTGAKIADDQIDSEHYVDGSIDTAHIGNSQVTTAKIADNNITTGKVLDGAITNPKLAANSVTTVKIADSNVTTAKLVNNAINNAKLADNSVSTSNIVANAVTNAKIADNQIDSRHYVDGSIDTAHLDTNVVTSPKLADNAVTSSKIAANAVTTDKIADSELSTLAGMQSTTASNLASSTALTATTAELNQLDGITLETSITTNSNTRIPTSKAVNDQILAVTNALGGFVAIANETSFPATNPDPSNNAGTVVSISSLASGLAVNSSGVATITNGAGTGNTVTITGFPSSLHSQTLPASSGLNVQTTSTLHTYTFHKQLASAADIQAISATVNSFSNRYRVSASAPTSSLDGGDLWYDTTNSKLMVYSSQNSAWEESTAIGNFFISTISSSSATGGGSATPNGTAYRFTISNAPTSAQQLLVSVDGVIQKPNSGSSQPSEGFVLVGNDIIFGAAPANGASLFVTALGSTVGIGTPSNNTVTTAILQNGSVTTPKITDANVTTAKIADANVTTAKIADDAVTAAKLANTSVTAGSYGSSSAIPAITVDAQGRITAASTNSIDSTSIANGTSNVSVAANGNTTVQRSSVTRLTVNHTGIDVAGSITVSGTVDGVDIAALNTTVGNINTDLVNDTTPQLGGDLQSAGNNITLGDSGSTSDDRLVLGAGSDLQLFHDGTHSFIHETVNGNLVLRTNPSGTYSGIVLQAGTENSVICNKLGSTDLYFISGVGSSSKKFETTSSGVTVTGDNNTGTLMKGVTRFCPAGTTTVKAMYDEGGFSGAGHFQVKDGVAFTAGDSSDLKIYHDGSHSRIQNSTGDLVLQGDNIYLNSANNQEHRAIFKNNGAVELYYDHSKKFETTSSGNNLRGTLQLCEGHFRPYNNNTWDLGTTSDRWRNIYTNDLHLSNEGSSNDIDGSWGNWTIQEGESDLFLKNNRSGKKYKFNLTEVS